MKILSIPVTCHGHYRPISDVQYNSSETNGYLILSGSKDCTAIIRDGVTGDWIGSLLGHKGAVWCCKLNSDSTRAFTGSGDFTAKIWSLEDGQCMKTIPHNHIVRSMDLSRDNSRLITADNQYFINLYDVNDSDKVLLRRKIHDDVVRKMILVDNDQCLLSISDDGKLVLSDLRDPGDNSQITVDLGEKLMDLTIENTKELDQKRLLLSLTSGQSVNGMHVDFKMPAKKPEVITKLKLGSDINAIDTQLFYDEATQQYQRFIACGCINGEIFTYKNWLSPEHWNNEDPSPNYRECYKGHFGPVHRVKFSPQIKFKDFLLSIVASGSEDGTVRLWQTFPGTEFGLWKAVEKPV